ncbi:Dual specificity protein phosphatase 14 [Dirofilaria immitis]|nr:Dual specificity protein phosphatase 14 [Dirofilaria immitis]
MHSFQKLRSLGITHVIDATNFPNNPRYEGIEFLNIMVDDSLIANLTPHFASAAQFIQNAQKKNGKTLIYCAAGISRSSALCIMSPFISPNVAFWRQMIEYEYKERGKSTVELLRGMARPIPDVYIKKTKSNAVAADK